MTVRTRMAFVVVFVLLVCVLAAPHYRTNVSGSTDANGSDSSLPTLQIRRTPAQLQQPKELVDVRFQPESVEAQPVHQRSRWSTDTSTKPQLTFVASQEHEPFPALDMPPPLIVNRTITPPVSGSDTRAKRQPLKPVRLLGQNIGSDAASTANRRIDGRDKRAAPNERRIDGAGGGMDRIDSSRAKALTPVVVSPRQRERWHRIVNGDTLDALAREYYGNTDQALLIFEANRRSLASPTILPLGTELIIPRLPAQAR